MHRRMYLSGTYVRWYRENTSLWHCWLRSRSPWSARHTQASRRLIISDLIATRRMDMWFLSTHSRSSLRVGMTPVHSRLSPSENVEASQRARAPKLIKYLLWNFLLFSNTSPIRKSPDAVILGSFTSLSYKKATLVCIFSFVSRFTFWETLVPLFTITFTCYFPRIHQR